MRLPEIKKFISEPAKHGIVTGFAVMSTAAGLQLATSLWSGTSPLAGVSGLGTAFLLSLTSGTVAALLASRSSKRQANGLKMAEALAKGDFSRSIAQIETRVTPLEFALERIAERELAHETESAMANKDAALRLDQLADALDAVPSQIAVYNKDGLLVSANRAFLNYCLEAGAVVALGMTWHEVMSAIAKAPGANLPANERQTWINQQEGLRIDAAASSAPVKFKCANGRVVELVVVKSADGNTTETIQDVTYTFELEDRAQRSIREAAAAESIKQVTISRLSHTIRTPMTGVLAATELLADSNLDERQRERLDIIRRSASTLLGVVQDMFDMATQPQAEIEAVLNPEPLHRTALVLKTSQHLMESALARLKSEGFEVGCAESLELLSETLKSLAGQNRLPELVVVPDLANREHLFALVGMLGNSSSLRVEIENEQQEQKEPVKIHEAGPSREVDVVIVESDEVNRIAYANALSSSKLKFRIAGTGEEATGMAKLLKCNLFVIDMTLPDMDGFQAATAIRKAYGSKPGLGSLVAMTSHYVGGDKTKCLAAGFDDYVLKPTIGSEMVALAQGFFEHEELKAVG